MWVIHEKLSFPEVAHFDCWPWVGHQDIEHTYIAVVDSCDCVCMLQPP